MNISQWRCATFLLSCVLFFPHAANAATFNVSNPVDFQSALTAAQSNGQNDTINVEVCSGTGCSGGVYVITTPLTYTAAASESFSLTIDGFDSDTRILDGGGVSTILRIDNAQGTSVAVRNMTLRNGNASGTGTDAGADGGALWVVGGFGDVAVTGSVYEGNVANDDGGAVFIRSALAEVGIVDIDDVTFENNQALGGAGDGAGDGGAVHVATNPGIPTNVVNTDFINNQSDGDGGGLEVEGLDPADEFALPAGPVDLFDVGFTENTAGANGGGAAFGSGSINIYRMGFVGNTAVRGGGLHVRDDLFEFTSANAGFAGNVATENGGALAIDRREGADIIIIHNTIYANRADGQGGGVWIDIFGSTGRVRAFNNIIYDNTGATAGLDVYIDNDPLDDIPSDVTFSYNDITSLAGFPDTSTTFFIKASSALTSEGNIDLAPVLPNINLADPDPAQGPTSPTIDAGLNDPIANNFPPDDWEGDPRPLDGDGDGTATNDMGMDEFVGAAAPQADLTIAKLADAGPIVGGMDLTYSITVGNNGPDAASGVTVTDILDSRLTFVSAVFDQGSPCTTSGTPVVVTCVLGSLASGADSSGTIVVTTPELADQVTITNVASVSGNENDPVSANDAASVDTVVVPPGPPMADLVLTKVASDNPFFSGGAELTWTLTVDNNGPATATGVVLTDTLPAGTTFVSATPTTGPGCTGPDAGGVVTCPLDDLANGDNATVFLVVVPDTVTEPTDITNNASVTANEDDPTPGDASASATVTINPPSSDMRVTVSASPDEPLVGDPITYTITVVNDGPSDDTGVFVDVTLPDGVTLQSAGWAAGNCDTSGDPVSCLIGDLANGASVTVTIVVLAPDQPATLVLEATVGGDIADPLQQNNSGSNQLNVIDEIEIVVRGVGGTGSIGPLGLAMLLAASAAAWLTRARRGARALAPLVLVWVVIVGVSAPTAHAQTGWYAGAGVGAADAGYSAGELVSDLAPRGWTITDVSVDDSDTAWKLFGGYEINQYFSVEAGYADLGEVETRFATSVPPNRVNALLRDTARVHPYLGDGWFAVGVVRWPLVPQQWSVSARAGLFAWEADIDIDVIQGATGSVGDKDTGTDAVYGVGVEWHANPQLSVTLEWERYRLNDWVDVPSLGLRWRF